MEMSANPFFQPPPESTGARTIYTVLNAQNTSNSINACYYPSYSNYSFYDQNDCFDYDHYDHDFHAFIMNSPIPSEPSLHGSNSFNSFPSFPSFPSGSGSSHASSRSDGLYKSPNFSPHSKHSRTPSSSSSSSFSSTTPSLTSSSSSQFSPSSSPSLFIADNDTDSDNCSYEEDEDMLFDATDKDQLEAFVPPQLGAAIDAAKFSSFGKFGNEICWEALPPAFDLGRGQEDKEGKKGAHPQYGQTVQIDWQPFDSFPNFLTMEGPMEPVPPPATNSAPSKSLASEFPPLSELLPEQQERLCAFLYKHRDCVASIEQIREVADQTNLTTIAIVYYLCFY